MLVQMNFITLTLLTILLLCSLCTANDCFIKEFDEGHVCVCDSNFCDTLPGIEEIEYGAFKLFTSSRDGLHFEVTAGSFASDNPSDFYSVTINTSVSYKTILGFGGAFTDSTGISIKSLPSLAQHKLMESYFTTSGSEYSIGRVPIGGTDFSTRGYSYADNTEGSIDSFELQDEDYLYKIPFILQARYFRDGNLTLFASPWSSPPWMKENNNYSGSFLKEEYYQMLADYYVKFFQAYRENDIEFWGMTVQNEPSTGILGSDINSVAWWTDQLIKFLTENLGPTIRNSSFSDLKMIIHDDSRAGLAVAQEYFNNEAALSYIDGVGVHWYLDFLTPSAFLDFAKTDKKDIFLLGTEACAGYAPFDTHVILGSWDRGASYASDIIDVLNHDGVGWVDWNMALNTEGGPTYIENFVDASIIVNSTAGEFYKQPMYYALAHFSKFLPPGSVRVESSENFLADLSGIKSVALKRPDGYVVLVVENTGFDEHDFVVIDVEKGRILVSLPGKSINTLVYH